MRHSGEPTVEEILDSIKQVIARDNREGAAQVRQHRETDGIADDDEESDADDDILDLTDSVEFVEDEESDEAADDAPLVTERSQASMRESLAALAMLSEPGAQPRIVRSGETSLEGLVRELLRPALAEWLDQNLPPIVERMVAEEIRRIAGKKS